MILESVGACVSFMPIHFVKSALWPRASNTELNADIIISVILEKPRRGKMLLESSHVTQCRVSSTDSQVHDSNKKTTVQHQQQQSLNHSRFSRSSVRNRSVIYCQSAEFIHLKFTCVSMHASHVRCFRMQQRSRPMQPSFCLYAVRRSARRHGSTHGRDSSLPRRR